MHYPLQLLVGKCKRLSVNAATDCRATSRLFITDKRSKLQFLIDTGSDLCVVPRGNWPDGKPTEYSLTAANGTPIQTYGTVTLHLDLGLRRDFVWNFVVANVGKPIIGADLLAHYGLLVDCQDGRLIDKLTTLSTAAIRMKCDISSIKTISGDSEYHALLSKYSQLTKPSGITRQVKHNTVHFIRTSPGPPVFARPRRLAPDRLKVAKEQFEEMVRDGTARRSDSPWASALHLAPKQDGWRPCGDYRALNARTIPDRSHSEHLEHLEQVFKRLAEYGLLINERKCVFGQREVTFLGFHISEQGTRPLDTRIEVIRDFPPPKTVSGLRNHID
ncbi:uncharacterized protein LOC134652260 [Cydia amplana]|uniref:uncharacterized protein LOC134652260 n=1 Tax=Cydia amplana TaxID=1869771 RepID=UPI002FE5D122